ncbi:EamA family transporter [Candidatus Woesearchaeota archaeon]|nr:EamA family transporter [Candidatus Woesearchaeota archaeon]
MLWFIYGFLVAFLQSLHDVFVKKSLKRVDAIMVAWAVSLFATIFLLPLLFFIQIPELNKTFWTALFLGSILNVLAIVYFMRALKYSDLSLAIPMLAFTPMFLIITSAFINKEIPSFPGFLGIMLVVAGSYALNARERHKGFLSPFKALLDNKGTRLMLFVAFVWSFTAAIDKLGVINSSPAFWSISISAVIFTLLSLLAAISKKPVISVTKSHFLAFLLIGVIIALIWLLQMNALKLALVSYVIAIKRLSIVFGVLFGYFVFKEKDIKGRLSGAVIMALGAALIVIS